MSRPQIVAVLFALLSCSLSLTAQERQISFDTKGTVLEIKKGSAFEGVWSPEVGDFERLLAFEADSVVTVEIYRLVNGVNVRERKQFTLEAFSERQRRVDTLALALVKIGGETSDDEIEDLRSTFTYDQTYFSSFHGLTASFLTESPSMFWIVTGGSYFAISAISDNMNVTRANVEAAKYGHLTGLLQGYCAGLTLFSGASSLDEVEGTVKGVLALTSIGGIAHAVVSYKSMTGPGVDPTVQYLGMTAERHSLVWGMGLMALTLGDDARGQTLMGGTVAISLSSHLWSSPLFGFPRRQMSWADALLADEFMTPWYMTLISLAISLELDNARQSGLLMSAGGISGYLLAINLNEGRMRSLGTVKRTRLLTYGGALLGLGIIAAGEVDGKAAAWIVSGTMWLGYTIGGRFGSSEQSSSWDLRVMPENVLLGNLMKPGPGRLLVNPLPVAELTIEF